MHARSEKGINKPVVRIRAEGVRWRDHPSSRDLPHTTPLLSSESLNLEAHIVGRTSKAPVSGPHELPTVGVP